MYISLSLSIYISLSLCLSLYTPLSHSFFLCLSISLSLSLYIHMYPCVLCCIVIIYCFLCQGIINQHNEDDSFMTKFKCSNYYFANAIAARTNHWVVRRMWIIAIFRHLFWKRIVRRVPLFRFYSVKVDRIFVVLSFFEKQERWF